MIFADGMTAGVEPLWRVRVKRAMVDSGRSFMRLAGSVSGPHDLSARKGFSRFATGSRFLAMFANPQSERHEMTLVVEEQVGGDRYQSMLEISRFFGIVIRMYVEAGGAHHRPHFHAYYQGGQGIYAIDEVEPIAGSLPRRQDRLTLAWAELHHDELLANWQRLQQGEPPNTIEPLKG